MLNFCPIQPRQQNVREKSIRCKIVRVSAIRLFQLPSTECSTFDELGMLSPSLPSLRLSCIPLLGILPPYCNNNNNINYYLRISELSSIYFKTIDVVLSCRGYKKVVKYEGNRTMFKFEKFGLEKIYSKATTTVGSLVSAQQRSQETNVL